MARARSVILAGGLLAALVVVLADQRLLHAQAAIQVTTPIPAWRAPAGELVLRGVGPPATEMSLYAGTIRLARTTSGAEGAFVLNARAPSPGRYLLAVQAAGDPVLRLELGQLLVRPLVVGAVGDVNLGDRVAIAMAVYGVRYPWLSVAPVLRSVDLAVANLECAVSRRGAPWPGKEYTFRGSPAALRAAASYAGIDVVSVANNHSLDYGRTAFLDTLAYARQYGIAPVGGGRNLTAARRPAIFGLGGLRIAFLGFSDVRPLGFDAGATRAGTTPAFPWLIDADVRAARRRADIVVVYYHWGIERSFEPTYRQRSLARTAFGAGATVVLGAHPHVLQPIGRVGTRRLVAWSLGNFVFGANTPGTASTGILRMRMARSGVYAYGFRRARIGGPYLVQPQLQ
jgi:poly-gamma-glutamate synthesis protein (capsule biosynthesis protein)